jgi:hypothetical protein
MTIKELYDQGKEFYLDAKLDKASDLFKRGINKRSQTDPYSYACLAMYYYEMAPEEIEDGKIEEHNKVMSWGGAHVRESSNPDPLVLYSLGNIAAKLGSTKESISLINPFYEALYRYLALLIYEYITGTHQDLAACSGITYF